MANKQNFRSALRSTLHCANLCWNDCGRNEIAELSNVGIDIFGIDDDFVFVEGDGFLLSFARRCFYVADTEHYDAPIVCGVEFSQILIDQMNNNMMVEVVVKGV